MVPERVPEIEAMFALDGVVAFEIEVGSTDVSLLHPEERLRTAGMAPARLRTFVSGRLAAAAALRALGVGPGPVDVGDTRSPVWPRGVVGSIAHTDLRCVVAVAPDPGDATLGIDLERTGAVTTDVVDVVLGPDDRRHFDTLAADDAARFLAHAFGTKEALYKAQFPLTGAWLGFHDVVFEPGPTPRLHPAYGCPIEHRVVFPVAVGLRDRADHVVAAVVLHHRREPVSPASR